MPPDAQPSRAVLGDVLALLDGRFDPATAEEWDQVGLVSGERQQPVTSVMFAVDPLPDVVQEAVDRGFDLLVTHHPLLLHGVHSVAADSAKGRIVRQLIRGNVALYCAHTNADSAHGGVNDALASAAGLSDFAPIVPIPDQQLSKLTVHTPSAAAKLVEEALFDAGIGSLGGYDECVYVSDETEQFLPSASATPVVGRIGEVTRQASLRLEFILTSAQIPIARDIVRRVHPYEVPAMDVVPVIDEQGSRGTGRWGRVDPATTVLGLAERLAAALPATHHGVRVAGDPDRPVTAAAVCGGAGDSLLKAVRGLPVDAFVTSDLRHHTATDHLAEEGCALIDIAHAAGEWLWLRGAADQLVADALTRGFRLTADVSTMNTDPWSAHVTRKP